MTERGRSYLYAGLAVFFWSTIATAFKLALAELSIIQLVFISSATSMFVLLLISIIEGHSKELLKVDTAGILRSTGLAFLNPLIYYLVLLKAYSLLPAQVAQPLNMIWPIVLVFLSVPLLNQKIPSRSFIALFISFVGVYLISSQGNPLRPGSSDLTGILLAAGSSIFWALYFIYNLKDKRPESVKLFFNFLIATIILALCLAFSGGFTAISLKGVVAGIYVGIFEMGLTFFLWLKALRLAATTDKISNLVFLAPFLSLLFINIFLNEPIYLTTPAGLLFIIGGIIYMNSGKKRSAG